MKKQLSDRRRGMVWWVAMICCLPGVIYAQISHPNDCSSLGTPEFDPAAYADSVYERYEDTYDGQIEVFTKKDLAVAFGQLQDYCAEKSTSRDEPCTNCLYAQSPFMFDHLYNVGMRKLDGIEDQCTMYGIDCQFQDGYDGHVGRREKITELAEDTEGHPPAELMGNFRKYRWDQESWLEKDIVANRYEEMCREASNVRDLIGQNDNSFAALQSSQDLTKLCKDAVRVRYVQEWQFVRTLMVEKWIQYHVENLQSYMREYFTKNRLADLLDKYIYLDGCFGMVLKYVSRTACCNE